MPNEAFVSPSEAGWNPDRLQRAYAMLERWTQDDTLPAAAVCVGGRAGTVAPRFFGRSRPEPGAPPLGSDALFLVASITKPVTVTAAMILVERGAVRLDDRVADFVPGFARNGKQDVTIRHLMTHTSGLPDMLPNNDALRQAHAPLSRFIAEVAGVALAFPPGTQVRYQSMGTAMLAEVVGQVTGTPFAEFLRREVFEPLSMSETSLGWRPETADRIAAIRLGAGSRGTDWNWNTSYWLGFGAPWGGLITSPADFARFCRMMLAAGVLDGVRLLSPRTVSTMTANQLASFPAIPEDDRRCRPWGLGWRLNWPGHSANFGDLLGPRTYGHWGATGTLCWIDPDANAFAVLFTTEPQGEDGRLLARASNMLAAALGGP